MYTMCKTYGVRTDEAWAAESERMGTFPELNVPLLDRRTLNFRRFVKTDRSVFKCFLNF